MQFGTGVAITAQNISNISNFIIGKYQWANGLSNDSIGFIEFSASNNLLSDIEIKYDASSIINQTNSPITYPQMTATVNQIVADDIDLQQSLINDRVGGTLDVFGSINSSLL